MVITEMKLAYLERGLLAQRDTGAAAAYRLVLPVVLPPRRVMTGP